MKIKKDNLFTSVLHYTYFRYYLHLLKQWDNAKSISHFNLAFGYSYSVGSMIGLIIFLIHDFFNIKDYVNIIISISVLLIASFFLPKIEYLENKYKDYDKESKEWKINGFLSLAFVFGCPILLILYMFLH